MNPFIERYASWRNVLILLGCFLVINVFLMLSLGGNPNLKPLDLEFGYNAARAYELLAAYNESERSVYLLIELTLDIIYPIIYSLFLSFVLFLLFANYRLAKLPLFLILIELLENTAIVVLLSNYPNPHPTIANVAGVLTALKWLLALICLVLVVFGFVRKAINRGSK